MRHLLSAALLLSAAGALAAVVHLASGPAAAVALPVTVVPAYSWGEMQDIFEEGKELDVRRREGQSFQARLAELKTELLHGDHRLDEAARAVVEAARQDNPCFLRHLEGRFDGASQQEKVALVLLTHVDAGLRRRRGPAVGEDVLERLRCELAAWPGVSPATLRYLD